MSYLFIFYVLHFYVMNGNVFIYNNNIGIMYIKILAPHCPLSFFFKNINFNLLSLIIFRNGNSYERSDKSPPNFHHEHKDCNNPCRDMKIPLLKHQEIIQQKSIFLEMTVLPSVIQKTVMEFSNA